MQYGGHSLRSQQLAMVTTEGRIIAGMLMVTGVGLFGTFTGFIASWFLGEKKV
jgi:hypothetical protein